MVTMENSKESSVFIKLKITVTIWSSNPTPEHIPEKTKTNSKKYIYPNVHSSTIYNSQDMEATQTSIYRWMDKDVVCVYIHTEEYYSAIKKEWNNAISSNTDGPRDHTKLNKSEKDKYYISLTCGILKKWYKWTYGQNRNRLTGIEYKLMVTKGERGKI